MAKKEDQAPKEHKPNWRETRATEEDIQNFLMGTLYLRHNVITGKWTLTAYADNGWNFMEGEHRGHQSAAWYFTASYQIKNLTLSLYAQHPFCSNPLRQKTEVLSRYIHKEVSQHSRDLGNMLKLNLTWRLSSGRKYRDIQRTMNHRDTETGILQSK